MHTGDLYTGHAVPLLIPEPIWREWSMNGLDAAAALTDLQAESGGLMGYEFDWGQIIEEVFDADPAAEAQDAADSRGLAVRWNFVLRDVHSAFLHAGGTLGELSDIAMVLLDNIEDSRHEVPEAAREDALPACIVFDEGNNVSAFAVCVVGRSNVARGREWMASYFVPAVLPMLVDRLRVENAIAVTPDASRSVVR